VQFEIIATLETGFGKKVPENYRTSKRYEGIRWPIKVKHIRQEHHQDWKEQIIGDGF